MIDLAVFAILSADPDVGAFIGTAGAVKARAQFSSDLPPCIIYSSAENRRTYLGGEAFSLREFDIQIDCHAADHGGADGLANAALNALITKQSFPVAAASAGGVWVKQITVKNDRESADQSPADGKKAVYIRTLGFKAFALIPVNVKAVQDNGDHTATWTFNNATTLPISNPLRVQGDFSAYQVTDGTTTYTPTAAVIVPGGVKFTYSNGTNALTGWNVAMNTALAFSAGVLAFSQSGATS